jgi:hypothetical protein
VCVSALAVHAVDPDLKACRVFLSCSAVSGLVVRVRTWIRQSSRTGERDAHCQCRSIVASFLISRYRFHLRVSTDRSSCRREVTGYDDDDDGGSQRVAAGGVPAGRELSPVASVEPEQQQHRA